MMNEHKWCAAVGGVEDQNEKTNMTRLTLIKIFKRSL